MIFGLLLFFCYQRLGFCGKSDRENTSPTESVFQMSSKFGNTLIVIYNCIRKEDTFGINAGGTAG